MQAKLVERATAIVAASSRLLLDAGVDLQFKAANAMEGAVQCDVGRG
jgi:hypothetical protein